MGFLYKLDFASGKSYIGITTLHAANQRFIVHRSEAVRTRSKLLIHNAWRKHGEPHMTVLAVASGDYLLELERSAIRAYGTQEPNGYNLTAGGDANPSSTPAARAKISAFAKTRIHSPETRAKMSAAKKGKPKSVETRARMSAGCMGRRPSSETREKLSLAAKGRIYTPETRAKMSAAGKVRVFTAEHRARIASSKTGQRHSPETIAKLKGRRENRKEVLWI